MRRRFSLTAAPMWLLCLRGLKRICICAFGLCSCHFKRREAPHDLPEVVFRDRVLSPRLPYEGLLPEVFPLSHPADLLLMPVDVLGHQNLKTNTEKRTNPPYCGDHV